jgi:acyl carrier protein
MAEIATKIIAIIAEQAMLEASDLSLDTTLADIGIDSLGMVEAIFAIEETFDIAIPFNANEPGKSDFDMTSLATIVAAVKGLIARKAA